ncbi:MAG TPA: hypothetical protein VEJ23_01570 [Solirubrobacteraceae bacterium]|nr:hypothetical protein [Solirubrobacteraceae bacterium]
MQSAFTLIVFGAVGLSLVISLLLLVTSRPSSGSVYDEIGSGGLVRDGDPTGPAGSSIAHPPDSPAARAEREREIRQMLGARSQRLVARGEAPLDIDAEVARLMAPAERPAAHDQGLVEEVRQLVIARNERRARQGLEELDVQAEIARTLAELGP